MATSRTGTARWKHVRSDALTQAQDAGLTHCPCLGPCAHHEGKPCGVTLDYLNTRTPTSAEPDHLQPWRRGGQDTLANVRVICRRCNQSRGSKPLLREPQAQRTTTTLATW